MLNKFNKLMFPKKYFSFGGTERIASARSKLTKLEREKTLVNSPNASRLSSQLKTHDKMKVDHEPAEVAIQKTENIDDINVNEDDIKPVLNYIDGEQSLQNDMRTINYKSKSRSLILI